MKLRHRKNLLNISSLVILLGITPLLAEQQESKLELGIVEGRDTQGLSLTLVSEVTSIKAEEPFQVALKIEHDKEFHTYWKNPGIVGIPTNIKWTLPAGFTASEIQWPYPEVSEMVGNLCYGYERDILLLVTITPPKTISEPKVTLEGKTQWMCCGRKGPCYPGFKSLTLPMTVGDGAVNPATKQLFVDARKSIPVDGKQFSASLLSKSDTEQIELIIKSSKAFTPVRIFNADGQHSPEIKNTLSKLDESTWKFSTTRSEHSRAETSKFEFVMQTKTGYFNLTAK